MRSLLLSGTFNDIRTRGGKLIISERDPSGSNVHELVPKNTDYESIVITRPEGKITMQAIQWLSRNNMPILMLDYRGELMSIIGRQFIKGKKGIQRISSLGCRIVMT